ncbi:MAG: hypothetical protein SLAVMIC_00414 [uncultured marine phage]|uniref:Lipoprotein n=1 Tax=uncultured marine phage TaxID=707152 RepID=A0A8D9C8W1_9VIRU|nr:MAG: hypothetical protein SLAVMIC_00414 [uncultured marine phage]
MKKLFKLFIFGGLFLLFSCGGHTCDAYRKADFTKKVEGKKVMVIEKAKSLTHRK